ncbi:MAG: BolA family protein [Acidobacteriota bacterium]
MDSGGIQRKIERGIPGARVEVAGEDAHFSALVVSPAFEGKSRVEQHQMVYALLREEMASEAVHALQLRTCTPAELEREMRPQER